MDLNPDPSKQAPEVILDRKATKASHYIFSNVPVS